MDAPRVTLEPINAGSVVDIAYQRIRTLIEDGELGPTHAFARESLPSRSPSRGRRTPGWREADAAEHRGILEAVAAGDPERAADLMERRVAATHEHWAREIHAESEAEEASV